MDCLFKDSVSKMMQSLHSSPTAVPLLQLLLLWVNNLHIACPMVWKSKSHWSLHTDTWHYFPLMVAKLSMCGWAMWFKQVLPVCNKSRIHSQSHTTENTRLYSHNGSLIIKIYERNWYVLSVYKSNSIQNVEMLPILCSSVSRGQS